MTELKKVVMMPIRHSKSLIEAIKKVRAGHPEAQEALEEGNWVIRDGDALLGGPTPSQWDAWMDAADGTSHTN